MYRNRAIQAAFAIYILSVRTLFPYTFTSTGIQLIFAGIVGERRYFIVLIIIFQLAERLNKVLFFETENTSSYKIQKRNGVPSLCPSPPPECIYFPHYLVQMLNVYHFCLTRCHFRNIFCLPMFCNVVTGVTYSYHNLRGFLSF